MDADAIIKAVERECYYDDHPVRPLTAALVNAVVGMPRDRILYADSSAGLLAYNIANENYEAVTAILEGSETP
jgi:hypothetical protein